jgi:D-glycero-D-manno-heptose 1,7-bisphosphate phosphatase
MERKIIFLDRDGVLNIERGEYTFKQEDVSIVPGLIDSLKILSKNGYEFIIISNQGGISKNIYAKADVIAVENILRKNLVENNIMILDSFYCPHHNDIENCLCRKPKSLLLEKAMAKYELRTENCFLLEIVSVIEFLVKI